MTTIAIENKKSIRKGMAYQVAIDETPDKPLSVYAANVFSEYEDNAKAYARKKVKEALYDDIKDPYLAIPGELQANGLEAGRAIGLKPFAEYPGYNKAIEAIDEARNYNRYLYDIKAGTTQEIQNFWKILTGNYLPTVSIPLTIGYNIYNQPQQQKTK